MKNRKGYYMVMMVGILIFAFLVPVLIRAASGAFISRFAPAAVEAETEEGNDRYRVMEGFTEAEGSQQLSEQISSGEKSLSDEGEEVEQHEHDPDLIRKELQLRKEQTDEDLAEYLKKQDPVLSESRSGMLEAFASGREIDLKKAVADHLYGTYGALYDISTINVVDFIDDNSTELTCQIQVKAKVGEREYSEYYYATYNKAYDFYSIYAYHE